MKLPNKKDIANAYTGIGFQKLFWIFIIAAFIGDIIEIFYCRIADGVWMSRSSFMYGQLTMVWGIGAVLLTLVMLPISKRGLFLVFIVGFVIGGIYEYACSYVTEQVYGAVFWDYSNMKFNIGGRTNLLYCIFWGLLSVAWIRFAYPAYDSVTSKIPAKALYIATIIGVSVLILDALLTFAVISRYTARQSHQQDIESNAVTTFIDNAYPDERIESRWPNLIITKGHKNDEK